jgi:uncharacterized protein YbjT (DUF2867 family)
MRVAIMGASGAVGSAVLAELQSMPQVQTITALVRRPLNLKNAHNVREQQVDVTAPETYTRFLIGHDAAICTLGVGQPSKVSVEEFKRIDHDAVLDFARACKAAGIRHFSLLSSVASDANARNTYLKSKGALRDAIAALGFERFSIYQPSMLITRENRYGFMQGVLLTVFPLLNPLLLGGLQKYRGVAVEDLGRAMARNIETRNAGLEILHYPDFMKLLP